MHTAVVSVKTGFSRSFDEFADSLVVDLGIVSDLYRLVKEFLQPSLLCQALLDLLPCTVSARIDLAFAVFSAAALSIQQTL